MQVKYRGSRNFPPGQIGLTKNIWTLQACTPHKAMPSISPKSQHTLQYCSSPVCEREWLIPFVYVSFLCYYDKVCVPSSLLLPDHSSSLILSSTVNDFLIHTYSFMCNYFNNFVWATPHFHQHTREDSQFIYVFCKVLEFTLSFIKIPWEMFILLSIQCKVNLKQNNRKGGKKLKENG